MKTFFNKVPIKLILAIMALGLVILFKKRVQNIDDRALQEYKKLVPILEEEQLVFSSSELVNFAQKQHLELAKLTKDLTYTRSEALKILQKFTLPKAVVEIQFTADFNYYVDLKGTWSIDDRGDSLHVSAPPLLHKRPNLDFSTLNFIVQKNGLFQDEDEIMERLKNEIPIRLDKEAMKNIEFIKDDARKELQKFLETWLSLKMNNKKKVVVKFTDPTKS